MSEMISETLPREIKENDVVILYESPDSMGYAKMKVGGKYDNRFGSFSHDDMIGKVFGKSERERERCVC